MKIMGVDPGTVNLGWATVVYEDGRFQEWAGSVIHESADLRRSLRLHNIHWRLLNVVQEQKPDIIAMETPFVGKNPQSALAIGQAQAMVMLAAEEAFVRLEYFAPAQVKLQTAGHGNATKEQVALVVRSLLKIEDELPNDLSDALAVAVAYANRRDEAAILNRGR